MAWQACGRSIIMIKIGRYEKQGYHTILYLAKKPGEKAENKIYARTVLQTQMHTPTHYQRTQTQARKHTVYDKKERERERERESLKQSAWVMLMN